MSCCLSLCCGTKTASSQFLHISSSSLAAWVVRYVIAFDGGDDLDNNKYMSYAGYLILFIMLNSFETDER